MQNYKYLLLGLLMSLSSQIYAVEEFQCKSASGTISLSYQVHDEKMENGKKVFSLAVFLADSAGQETKVFSSSRETLPAESSIKSIKVQTKTQELHVDLNSKA